MVNGYTPVNLKEALRLRAERPAERPLVPYAGGTDLMVKEERPGLEPREYLFLHKIDELRQVREEADLIRFGAASTFTELLKNDKTPPLLKEALSRIAAPAIRNTGTIGGNIGNGSAKADSALIFFVTDSSVRLVSEKGERVLPIRDFYQGRQKLDLHNDELIAEVLMPKKWLAGYSYHKVGARKALAISRVSFAGLFALSAGVIAHVAAAFGAVSDVIIRRADIDAMLIGKTLDEAASLREAYLASYEKAIVPTSGRVSSTYRKQVCLNLLGDFLATNGV
jgi:CO/xanthine dehydrogenase FAD-binding subunit